MDDHTSCHLRNFVFDFRSKLLKFECMEEDCMQYDFLCAVAWCVAWDTQASRWIWLQNVYEKMFLKYGKCWARNGSWMAKLLPHAFINHLSHQHVFPNTLLAVIILTGKQTIIG